MSLKFDQGRLQKDLLLLPRYHLRPPPACASIPPSAQAQVLNTLPCCHTILLQLEDLPARFLSWSLLRSRGSQAATCFGETNWPHCLHRPVVIFAIFTLSSLTFQQTMIHRTKKESLHCPKMSFFLEESWVQNCLMFQIFEDKAKFGTRFPLRQEI